MGLEQNVNLMNMEQRKEKENLGRMEVANLKNSEDFRNMISNVQHDVQNRLEIKVTDLVNGLRRYYFKISILLMLCFEKLLPLRFYSLLQNCFMSN